MVSTSKVFSAISGASSNGTWSLDIHQLHDVVLGGLEEDSGAIARLQMGFRQWEVATLCLQCRCRHQLVATGLQRHFKSHRDVEVDILGNVLVDL